jgi:hypothetical protein
MVGKIFITRSGYDPQLGKHVKDPYLGETPSLGACRPDLRRQLAAGDHVFVISGKVPDANQFVMGGFEVRSKIDAREAWRLFPEQRLRRREDGQLTGNIIVNSRGKQHRLDDHEAFEGRTGNYVVGENLIALVTPGEIARGREQTVEVLRDILHRGGRSPWQVVGHWGTALNEDQVLRLREWLLSIRKASS